MQASDEWEYVGFWWRSLAYSIDAVLITVVMVGFGYLIYGPDYFSIPENGEFPIRGPADLLLTYVLPPVAIIGFWVWRGATPGKMAIGARIVCASDGTPRASGRCIGRYFAYFVSMIPLGLGFLWIAFDAHKQGWHDKLAGTAVVRARRNPAAPPARTP
ncbi:MAG: RDD family protein [Defluviicoccus sp.]|nr:MAG: RDD family protein [Defluviicoccus sp.]